MSSNKEAQAARSAADRRLREAHPGEYAAFMEQEHAKRGLTWNRRVTPEERAYRERVEREKRALARIHQIAEDNGLSIAITERASGVGSYDATGGRYEEENDGYGDTYTKDEALTGEGVTAEAEAKQEYMAQASASEAAAAEEAMALYVADAYAVEGEH